MIKAYKATGRNQGIQGIQGLKGTNGTNGIDGAQGAKGDRGDDGTSMKVLGTYPDLSALETAVITPEQGDMYNIGIAYPYYLYMWQENIGAWENQGQLQGAKGDQGIQGVQGIAGTDGAKGDKGDTGANGADGLTTAVKVGATQYNHSDGVVSLPAYPDISGKADKTYVDSKVKTDVPTDAIFTDTVYTHPATHTASVITQDANNRFSTDAEKANWNAKAAIASPTFTGAPKAPTATTGTNTTQIATTQFVQDNVSTGIISNSAALIPHSSRKREPTRDLTVPAGSNANRITIIRSVAVTATSAIRLRIGTGSYYPIILVVRHNCKYKSTELQTHHMREVFSLSRLGFQ